MYLQNSVDNCILAYKKGNYDNIRLRFLRIKNFNRKASSFQEENLLLRKMGYVFCGKEGLDFFGLDCGRHDYYFEVFSSFAKLFDHRPENLIKLKFTQANQSLLSFHGLHRV
jgi:hypothetical protein